MKKNGFISMTLVYTFLVLFMFLMLAILKTYTEKDKYLQAINDQIDNDIGIAKGSRSTVINKILEDNMPSSDFSIKYYRISNDENGNGNGLYYMDKKGSDNTMLGSTDENTDGYTSRIYYYRGSVKNNYLLFADKCFRIIRTNEDGSIRMVYLGEKTSDNKCNPNNNGIIGKKKFSGKEGESVEYVSVKEDGVVPSYDLDNEQSPIIEVLNEWYRQSFIPQNDTDINYTDFISKDTMFCNNKMVSSVNANYYRSRDIGPTFKNENAKNIYKDSNILSNIILNCEGNSDRFSLNDNNILYPVGLLTAQDIALAGGYLYVDGDEYNGGPGGVIQNTSFYLHSSNPYWTMSPLSQGKMIYVDGEGIMKGANSSSEYGIRPVISLDSNVVIGSGKGTASDPYVLR